MDNDIETLKTSADKLCEMAIQNAFLLEFAEKCLLDISKKEEYAKSVTFEETLWDIKTVCKNYWDYKKLVIQKRDLERIKK